VSLTSENKAFGFAQESLKRGGLVVLIGLFGRPCLPGGGRVSAIRVWALRRGQAGPSLLCVRQLVQTGPTSGADPARRPSAAPGGACGGNTCDDDVVLAAPRSSTARLSGRWAALQNVRR